MATTSTSSTAWGCPHGLLPGLGSRLFTFRRGLLKCHGRATQPRPTAFSGPVRFSRTSSDSVGGKRFCLPPERASGAQPLPTTRPPEFTAWVYHALGGGAVETILSLISISITLMGIAVTLILQRAQTTGILPVIGTGAAVAQQAPAAATATPRDTPSDSWQHEVVSGRRGAAAAASRSAASAETAHGDDYDTAYERAVNRSYRAMPYGMSAADHVYDTPWSNLCRWAVHALHYQEEMTQQAATTAAATEASAVTSEQFDMDAVHATDIGMSKWTADSLMPPAAAAAEEEEEETVIGSTPAVPFDGTGIGTGSDMGTGTAPMYGGGMATGTATGTGATAPSELGYGSVPISVAEVQTTVRRSASAVRGARALLRLSMQVAQLPLRVVDWALQVDQPIHHPISRLVPAASTAPRGAPAAPDTSAAETEGAAKEAIQPPATPFAAPTPLDVRIPTAIVDGEAVERPVGHTATAAAMQSTPTPQRQQQPEWKKGRDPWAAATEVEVEAAGERPGWGPGGVEMHALRDTAANVRSFAKAAPSAPGAQLSLYDKTQAADSSTGSTPAVVAQLPGGAATAMFVLALSSWLSAWAVVLLARAASRALGRRAATAGAAAGHGMSTREYFGPMYDYVRQMGPGYPRACVPICTPSPPLGIYGTAPANTAIKSAAAAGSSSSSNSSSSSAASAPLDYTPKPAPVTQAAVAAQDTAARVPAAVAPAVAAEEPQSQPEAQPVMAASSANVPSSDAAVRQFVAGGNGTDLEEMAGLLRLLPPPPSRRGWTRSAAAAAGLKPNPPVLTDPTNNWGLTPASAAAEAAAAAATAAPNVCGRRDPSFRERCGIAEERILTIGLPEAMEAAEAAAEAVTTELLAALVDVPDTVFRGGKQTMANSESASDPASGGAEAAGAIPVSASAPTPAPDSTCASVPAAGDVAAYTAAVPDGDVVDDVISEVHDDGANWQLGPACELAVPVAVPFAVPLAVPLPPAVPLPLSAAELAAPSLNVSQPSAAAAAAAAATTTPDQGTGSAPPSEPTDSFVSCLQHQRQTVLPDCAATSPELARAAEAGATELPAVAVPVAAPPGSRAQTLHAKSIVSTPELDLSATICQPDTALAIRCPPPPPPQQPICEQEQQQQADPTESLESSAATADGTGYRGTYNAVDPDPSYEHRLRDAIRVVFSGGVGVAQTDTGAGADVDVNPADVVRHMAEAGLLYKPMEQWVAETSERVSNQDQPGGSADGTMRDLLPTKSESPLALDAAAAAPVTAMAAVAAAAAGVSEVGGSCLLPAVVAPTERGIVAVKPKGPVDTVASRRRDGPLTRGSLHSQTVTVTIDADCISGVSKVQVDVAPAALAAPSPRALADTLPPAAPPPTDAPWVLAAPAVAPPVALLPAASPGVPTSGLSALPRAAPSATATAAAAAAAAVEESRVGEVAGDRGPINYKATDLSIRGDTTSAAIREPDAKARSVYDGGEWAFYAGQFNGMAASELRPYNAPASRNQLAQAEAAAWKVGATSAPDAGEAPAAIKEEEQQQQQQQHEEVVAAAVATAKEQDDDDEEEVVPPMIMTEPEAPEAATWESESIRAVGADAAGGTAFTLAPGGDLLGEELFNRLTGVPELDRAILTTGGVVPGAWTATGDVKMGSDIKSGGGAMQRPVSNTAVAVAAAVAAAAAAVAAAATPGSAVRRGLFDNRRRRGARLLRLRGEAAKAATAAAMRAANAAAASTLYGVRVDEMFSAVEQGGPAGADATRVGNNDEFGDDVLNALAALVAAASGAASPAATQPAVAPEAKAAEAEGLKEDLDDVLALARLVAAASGAVSPQPDEVAEATIIAPGAVLSPSAETVAAAAAEVDIAELQLQAELAAAANGAVIQRGSDPDAAVDLTSGAMQEPPVQAAVKASVAMSANVPLVSTSVGGPASSSGSSRGGDNDVQLLLMEDSEAEYDTEGGRHFLPLASAVAMFNKPHISAAESTATGPANGADVSPAAAVRYQKVSGSTAGTKDDGSASARRGTAGEASTVRAGAPPLAAVGAFVLPPAGSLAATFVGLGVAAAAAGAAAFAAAEAAAAAADADADGERGQKDGEDVGDFKDPRVQAGLAAAAAAAVPSAMPAAPTGSNPAAAAVSMTMAEATEAEAAAAKAVVPEEIKAPSATPVAVAAVKEDQGEEDDEQEALTWLAGLMGAPVAGFVSTTINTAEAGPVEAATEAPKHKSDPPPSSVNKLTGSGGTAESTTITIAAAEAEGAGATVAAVVAPRIRPDAPQSAEAAPARVEATAAAETSPEDAGDVEVTFGDTTVFLPEPAVGTMPPVKSAVVAAATAWAGATPPPAVPYATYLSIPAAAALAEADVDAFAVTESSSQEEEAVDVNDGGGEGAEMDTDLMQSPQLRATLENIRALRRWLAQSARSDMDLELDELFPIGDGMDSDGAGEAKPSGAGVSVLWRVNEEMEGEPVDGGEDDEIEGGIDAGLGLEEEEEEDGYVSYDEVDWEDGLWEEEEEEEEEGGDGGADGDGGPVDGDDDVKGVWMGRWRK